MCTHVCVSSQHECCGISQMFTLCVFGCFNWPLQRSFFKIPYRAHSQLSKSAHTHTNTLTQLKFFRRNVDYTGAPSLRWETSDTGSGPMVISSDVNRKGSDIFAHNDREKNICRNGLCVCARCRSLTQI